MKVFIRIFSLFIMLFGLTSVSRAEVRIVIDEVMDSARPIAVVPFKWNGPGSAPADIAKIISDDLRNSGKFNPMEVSKMPQQPTSAAEVNPEVWSAQGIEAVIDKDFASQRLAELVDADLFIVLTGVDYVFVNYNKPDQAKLEHVNVAQLEEYIKQEQFAPGSMLPKVEAAIAFVNGRPEGKAVITSLENLGALIESESGTIIEKG